MNRLQRRKHGIRTPGDPIVKRMFKKVNRNDQCPCGSGKKFKNCECFNREKSYYNFKEKES